MVEMIPTESETNHLTTVHVYLIKQNQYQAPKFKLFTSSTQLSMKFFLLINV